MSGRREASGEQVDAISTLCDAMHRRAYRHDVSTCRGCTDPVYEFATEARAMLEDPAARAALLASFPPDEVLDALVQRGVLTEERAPGLMTPDGRFLVREHLHTPGLLEGRRLVTAWQALTSDEAIAILRERLTGPGEEA